MCYITTAMMFPRNWQIVNCKNEGNNHVIVEDPTSTKEVSVKPKNERAEALCK